MRQSCRRSELAAAQIGANSYGYAYDSIGNRQWFSANGVTNGYAANCLNQYSGVRQPDFNVQHSYDADGNLTRDDRFSYAYDAENRLVSACPLSAAEGSLAVENRYDHKHRRVRKIVKSYSGGFWQTTATHSFVWDGNNIVLERIAFADGATRTCEYFWGNDLSGTEQGAGGVGGLLAVSIDGTFFIPCYDHNGNIVCYVSETGVIAGQYVYDPYGNVIEQYGTMPNQFNFGFSAKYFDRETGMLSYQRRFYRSDLGRWLNRDPIGERDCLNLYVFCRNSIPIFVDYLGLTRVAITMGTELKDSGRGELEFLRVTVTTIEPPKSGWLLNFIQLKKPYGQGWSVDQQGGLGPYYYNLIELGQSTTLDNEGRKQVTFWDAPGGAMSGPTQFYLAIIEMHSRCTMNKNKTAITKCFDSVRLVAS
ncbi:MAG: RHS repeat-associated core domain-containing protein, partial [bacterium]|nr:RHS repeat-associated core domain-containing protein [bacterium]